MIGPGSVSGCPITRDGFQYHQSRGIAPETRSARTRSSPRFPTTATSRAASTPASSTPRPVTGFRVRSPPLTSADRDAARSCAEEGEKGRNREVVGDGGHDRGELHQHRDEHEPEVVVVHRAAREPRVVGRKLGRLDDRVQVREVHRLLAAERRVPQIGVRPAHEGGSAEQHPEDGFLDEEEPAGLDQPGAELPAVRHRDTQRAGSNDADRDPDGRLRERRDPRAREQPHDPGDEEQSDGTGQRVPPVGKPRGRQPDVRQGDAPRRTRAAAQKTMGARFARLPGSKSSLHVPPLTWVADSARSRFVAGAATPAPGSATAAAGPPAATSITSTPTSARSRADLDEVTVRRMIRCPPGASQCSSTSCGLAGRLPRPSRSWRLNGPV